MRRATRRGAGVVLLAALGGAAACARVRPLEGGPIDHDPPHLLHVSPRDSSTNIDRLQRFELEWSEPLGSTGARGAVRFEPAVRLADAQVKGNKLVVTLADSLPPDTTVVLVLSRDLQDRRGRDNRLSDEIALVYSTGPRLRAAAVYGKVTLKGLANPKVAVQWEPVPADTGHAAARRRGPAAEVNDEGLFRLAGIPPDRRFVLRGFQDTNGDLHPSEGELWALYPDTLLLGPGAVRRGVSWNIIDVNEPGEVSGVAVAQTHVTGPVAVALRFLGPLPGSPARPDTTRGAAVPESALVRADTLRPLPLPVSPRAQTPWDAAYRALLPRGFVRREWTVVYASPRGDYSVRVPPGRHALLAFVDARRDSAPGLYVAADSTTLLWEPLQLADTLVVEPGSKTRARSIEIRAP